MSLTLITDRTAADLAAAREIIAKVQRGETLTEAEQSQFDAGLRGCYNASDINRVEAAVKSIAAALNAAGYAVEVGETKHRTLPEGYTLLEYLQSTGTQYIDTGFKPNQDTRVVMDFEIATFFSITALFGGRTAYQSNDFTFWHYSATSFLTNYNATSNEVTVSPSAGRFTADKNKNVTTIGGVTMTATYGSFQSPYNMFLFTINQADTAESRMSKIKLYSCKIYNNGTLIRNMIPAKNSSGTLGLYDTVNGAFYTNAGTGTFSAGSEIETESHDWQTTDIIRLSQWRQYLANVQALRDAYTSLSTTPELPQPTDKLGIEGANNIERVLADIDLLINGMKSIYRKAGTFTAGGSYTRQFIRSV